MKLRINIVKNLRIIRSFVNIAAVLPPMELSVKVFVYPIVAIRGFIFPIKNVEIKLSDIFSPI